MRPTGRIPWPRFRDLDLSGALQGVRTACMIVILGSASCLRRRGGTLSRGQNWVAQTLDSQTSPCSKPWTTEQRDQAVGNHATRLLAPRPVAWHCGIEGSHRRCAAQLGSSPSEAPRSSRPAPPLRAEFAGWAKHRRPWAPRERPDREGGLHAPRMGRRLAQFDPRGYPPVGANRCARRAAQPDGGRASSGGSRCAGIVRPTAPNNENSISPGTGSH